MNKLIALMSAAVCAGIFASSASAAYIEASASCSSTSTDPVGCDQDFNDDYGFYVKIDGTGSTDGAIYSAILTNTSPTASGPVIDQFFFNLNPDLTLNTDFSVINFDPTSWTVTAATGGVLFDYVGDAGTPAGGDNRIAAQDSLTFQIELLKDLILPTDYTSLLDYFLFAESNSGAGAGGGDDSGQFAVSFQTLGDSGDDSDLLAANWRTGNGNGGGGGGGNPAPEPGILFLMGAGLMGLGMARRRKSA